MLQTLLQSTRLAQHEYINAFSTDGWRDAISTSVKSNHSHLYPSDPNDPDLEDEAEVELDEEPEDDCENASEQHQPAAPRPVGAGLARPSSPAQPARTTQPPARPRQPAADTPPTTRPSPADTEAALHLARSIFPPAPNSTQAPPTPPPLPPPKPATPNREIHFDHTYRLTIDGKPS